RARELRIPREPIHGSFSRQRSILNQLFPETRNSWMGGHRRRTFLENSLGLLEDHEAIHCSPPANHHALDFADEISFGCDIGGCLRQRSKKWRTKHREKLADLLE